MIVAFFVTFAALVVAVAALLRREHAHAHALIRFGERHDRLREQRESDLLNRLAHAYDKPWEEPPAEAAVVENEDEETQDARDLVWDLSHDDEPVGASF